MIATGGRWSLVSVAATVLTAGLLVAPDLHAQPAHLHLTSDQEDLTFYVSVTSAQGTRPHLEPLCTAPCEVDALAGTAYLALSRGSGDPTAVRDPIEIGGDASLHGEYSSRLGTRILGVVIHVVGNFFGALFTFGGLEIGSGEIFAAGILTFVASTIAGPALYAAGDLAEVEVR